MTDPICLEFLEQLPIRDDGVIMWAEAYALATDIGKRYADGLNGIRGRLMRIVEMSAPSYLNTEGW